MEIGSVLNIITIKYKTHTKNRIGVDCTSNSRGSSGRRARQPSPKNSTSYISICLFTFDVHLNQHHSNTLKEYLNFFKNVNLYADKFSQGPQFSTSF